VFSLSYDVGAPLSTVLTPEAMMAYKRIFKLLWDVKHVEHSLSNAWHTMKPNSRHNKQYSNSSSAPLWHDLRRRMSLRSEMSHFITNLQYYFVFEVLEGSRDIFMDRARKSRDLDELIDAHETYLQTAVRKSLLDKESQHMRDVLYELFEVTHRFSRLVERLHADIDAADHVSSDAQGGRGGDRRELPVPELQLQEYTQQLDKIHQDYNSHLNSFVSLLPTQAHVDLRFLKLRLDFTDFYARGFEDDSDDSMPTTPQ